MSKTYSLEERKYFLSWKSNYESEIGERLLRRVFDPSDDLVSRCAAWISNEFSVTYSNQEIRELSISVERDCLWTLLPEEVEASKEEYRQNVKDYGTGGGLTAIDKRNSDAIKIDRKSRRLSQEYMDYISGPVWTERSLRYLTQNCQTATGSFKCESCGTESTNRTLFNVHHNDYSILNGEEPDTHLMGVCAGRCHELADLARYANRGKVCHKLLSDLLGLFRCQVS